MLLAFIIQTFQIPLIFHEDTGRVSNKIANRILQEYFILVWVSTPMPNIKRFLHDVGHFRDIRNKKLESNKLGKYYAILHINEL